MELDEAGSMVRLVAEATGAVLDARPVPLEDEAVGVLLVGFNAKAAGKVALPRKALIPGLIAITGEELLPLDKTTVETTLADWLADRPPAAIAVSGMNSAMNPIHESAVARLSRERTSLPVVEGRFFSYCPSAPQRATLAGEAARWLAAVRELAVRVHQGGSHQDESPAIPLVGGDVRLLDAWCNSGAMEAVGVVVPGRAIRLEARITRVSQRVYALHTSDGRFEFESLPAARLFGEAHLRERVWRQAGEARIHKPLIEVQVQDHFAPGRGRKGPMRVFIESRLTACVRGLTQ